MPTIHQLGAAGPISSLKALGRTAVDVVRTRIDLLGVEMAQEQDRLAQLALYAALALIALGLGLQLVAVLAVAWFWDTPYRLLAAACAAALFAGAAVTCALVFASKLRSKPTPFSSTLHALAADLDALR